MAGSSRTSERLTATPARAGSRSTRRRARSRSRWERPSSKRGATRCFTGPRRSRRAMRGRRRCRGASTVPRLGPRRTRKRLRERSPSRRDRVHSPSPPSSRRRPAVTAPSSWVPRRQVHPLPQAQLAPGVPALLPGVGADGLAVHGQPPGAEGTQAHVAGPLAGVSVEGGRPRGAQGKRGRRLPHGAGDPHGPAAVLARPAPGEAGRGAAVAGAEAEPVVPVFLAALGAAQEPEAEMGHGGEHPPLGGAVLAVAGGPGGGPTPPLRGEPGRRGFR